MAWSAIDMLVTSGNSRNPHPDRVPGLADLFGEQTMLNWVAFVVFVGCGVAIHLLSQRARHTESGSAA